MLVQTYYMKKNNILISLFPLLSQIMQSCFKLGFWRIFLFVLFFENIKPKRQSLLYIIMTVIDSHRQSYFSLPLKLQRRALVVSTLLNWLARGWL